MSNTSVAPYLIMQFVSLCLTLAKTDSLYQHRRHQALGGGGGGGGGGRGGGGGDERCSFDCTTLSMGARLRLSEAGPGYLMKVN